MNAPRRLHASPFILHNSLFIASLLLFLSLGAYQLVLPGLHYDEAKEAGLNAMQLVTWQSLTAFRDAAVQVGPWRLPLMVQDYIGALNVALATPFLTIGGINTVALRWLSLLTGALTLFCAWRVAKRLGGPVAATATATLLAVNPSFIFWSRQGIFVTNLTALLFTASLLTGLRWWTDRRPRALWLTAFLWGTGIYAKLLFVWAIGAMVSVATIAWAVGRWQNSSHASEDQRASGNTPLTSNRRPTPGSTATPPSPSPSTSALTLTPTLASASFLLPLIPLILFNLRTSGTLTSIFGNLGQSYYGVDNSAYLPNLAIRLRQVVTLMRGDHLWYLGGIYANAWVPWVAGGLLIAAALVGMRSAVAARNSAEAEQQGIDRFACLLPVALLALIVAQSAFTVSDLFITHYALLLPLIPLAAGLAFSVVWDRGKRRFPTDQQTPLKVEDPDLHGAPQIQEEFSSAELLSLRGAPFATKQSPPHNANRITHPASAGTKMAMLWRYALGVSAFLALVTWAGGDLWTTIRYHRALTASGGHASHSDAIYDLAGYLDRGGLIAPVALDWGIDAQVRYLTANRVRPIEVFGYGGLDAPDPGFADRVVGFLDNPDNVYMAHVPDQTVFRGRMETLSTLAEGRGMMWQEEIRFSERNGTPLFVLYRLTSLPDGP